MSTSFISAILTPLQNDDSLHVEGLRIHLEDQWQAGINGALVAGTMGLMQLQSDRTYLDLVKRSIEFTAGRGEIMVGVGDASFVRTRDRIRLVEDFDIDGLVVLTPYLVSYTQAQLVNYFSALADISKKPIYLYNLPQLAKMLIEFETVVALSKHPNIRGIKCSNEYPLTQFLFDAIGDRFRIIVAQPFLVDVLARSGVREHLDGVFAVAPQWTVAIGRAADRGDWEEAARCQRRMTSLLRMLRERYPLLPAVTAIVNARGVPGKSAPAPIGFLTDQERRRLFEEPIVQELVKVPAGATG